MTSKTNLFLFLAISAIMITSSFAINDAFAAKDDKIKFQDIFGDPDFDAILVILTFSLVPYKNKSATIHLE